MSTAFTGHYVLIYPDFTDTATGKTLVVTPGQSYTPAPSPGRPASLPAVPGDGRWGGHVVDLRAPQAGIAPQQPPQAPPAPRQGAASRHAASGTASGQAGPDPAAE